MDCIDPMIRKQMSYPDIGKLGKRDKEGKKQTLIKRKKTKKNKKSHE